MKRYVLIIITVFVLLMWKDYVTKDRIKGEVTILKGRVDSLKNVIYFNESTRASFENNTKKLTKTASDSMNLEIKARDSAIFSHGQQVRWLQWHVERLNKSTNQKP